MGTIKITNEIVQKYDEFVHIIVRRFINSHPYFEFDTILSYAYEGLMDAYEKYDNSKGAKFETYATRRINGCIIDGIRRDGVIKRNDVKLIKNINALKSLELTDEELAKKLHVHVSRIENVKKLVDACNMVYLDDPNTEVEVGVNDQEMAQAERYELSGLIEEILSDLTPKEKEILKLIYYEELKNAEISRTLGVSESRVSQVHYKALKKLHTKANMDKVSDFINE